MFFQSCDFLVPSMFLGVKNSTESYIQILKISKFSKNRPKVPPLSPYKPYFNPINRPWDLARSIEHEILDGGCLNESFTALIGCSFRPREGPYWSLVLGPWSLVLGPWSLVLVLGLGPWSWSLVLVLGLGPWSLVLGPWSLVLGRWSLVLVLVLGLGPWSLVSFCLKSSKSYISNGVLDHFLAGSWPWIVLHIP